MCFVDSFSLDLLIASRRSLNMLLCALHPCSLVVRSRGLIRFQFNLSLRGYFIDSVVFFQQGGVQWLWFLLP